MYIVFEGIVGTGKSTQSKILFEHLKSKFPDKEIILTREPGGTEIAEEIRKVVQGKMYTEKMDYTCEAYLYASARAQSLRKVVKPIIDKGGIVIADRSFISSMAYQGHARKLGVQTIYKINEIAIQGFVPDMVILLKLDPMTALSRTFDKDGDKFENKDAKFFEEIQKGYEEISKMKIFEDRWYEIDACGSIEEISKKIKSLF